MDIFAIIFFASGTALILMLLLKRFQMRTGYAFLFPGFRNNIEVRVQKRAVALRHRFRYFNSRSFYLLMVFCLTEIRRGLIKVENKLGGRSSQLLNGIRGRKNIENRGTASRFLNDISHHKETFRE
jgi:hypothetical protein